MSLTINLSVIAILSLTICTSHVRASEEHCNTDNIRRNAIESCSRLMDQIISKRQTDLSDFGYNIERISARHHHHRHPFAKKLTHSRFPKGGYLLVHYPYAQHIYSSNNNYIDDDASYGNELSNDILSEDLPTSTHSESHQNKHVTRSRRNADPKVPIEHCCTQETEDICGIHFCH